MRKAFMMIELVLIFSGLLLMVNLSFSILNQRKPEKYVFIEIDKECKIECALKKRHP